MSNAWLFEFYESTTSTGLPLTPISELALTICRANKAGMLEMFKTKPVMTIFDGQVVYQA